MHLSEQTVVNGSAKYLFSVVLLKGLKIETMEAFGLILLNIII